MSLFVLASKDGWVNIMYTGLDAVAIDQQVSERLSDCCQAQLHDGSGEILRIDRE